MCYSAQIEADYRKYVKMFGAQMDIREFARLYWERVEGSACLWSRWSAQGQPDLLSFAAITDDPPEEVAAAGHDRCIVPIKPEHVDAWLNPIASDLHAQHAILDDRDQPYYDHRLAA